MKAVATQSPMKIVHVVEEFPVPSETFVLNQIAGALDRGHEVEILALQGSADPEVSVHPIVEQYKLLNRTRFSPRVPANYLERWFTLVRSFSKWPTHQQHWKATLQLLNPVLHGRDALSLRLIYRALPLLGGLDYDIIHCQFGTTALVILLFKQLGLITGKLVVSFRGRDISWAIAKFGDRVYDDLLQAADAYLPNSQFFAQRVLDLGGDPNKLSVHRSGIDVRRFAFRPRTRLLQETTRIITIGRLVEKKGIEYAIRAVARLARQRPVEYLVVGDGPLRSSLQALVDSLDAGDTIQLVGWKLQNELIELLDRSHLLLAPSVTAADGDADAPVNTLKEGMAMGLPTIGTWHGGIPELIHDSVSGFLVPERDADALFEKLLYLVDQPQDWEAMGWAGRREVEATYNMEVLNDELVNLYRSLISI